MTDQQIDELVEQIGDALLERLGVAALAAAPAVAPPHSCACSTADLARPSVTEKGLAERIEPALVKPEATLDDLLQFCDGAVRYKAKSITVLPVHVAAAVRRLSGAGTAVRALCGYPLGASVAPVKALEAETALAQGANGLDVVVHTGALRSGEFDRVYAELRWIGGLTRGARADFAAVAETPLLDERQTASAAALAHLAGARSILAAGGWSSHRPVVPAHVELLSKAAGGSTAAGVIDTAGAAHSLGTLAAAGASRLVTAAGLEILRSGRRA